MCFEVVRGLWHLHKVTSELIVVQAEGNFKTQHEEMLNMYIRRLLRAGISHPLTPDFEWDHSLRWIYLKVGQQPQRRPQRSKWGGGPRFQSQFKCRLFVAVNHTHVFIIDFQMIGFYITGLGSTVLHSWIYIMPKE